MALTLVVNGKKHDFSACIFDFDGVIMNTEKYHFAAWSKAASLVGVTISADEYSPLKSTGRENTVAFIRKKYGKPLSDELKQEIISLKDAAYSESVKSLSDNDFIVGAREFLQYLYTRNIKAALASSGMHSSELIKKYGLEKYFAAVVDGSFNLPKKPQPHIFNYAAQLLGADSAECLVFEDSPAGIEASVRAGMVHVAIGGITSATALLAAPDFGQLFTYLKD